MRPSLPHWKWKYHSILMIILWSFSGYLEIDRNVFKGGQDFEISIEFRTDQLNSLLIFTYNKHTEDFMLVRWSACWYLFFKVCERNESIVAFCVLVCIFRCKLKEASCHSFSVLMVTRLNSTCGWGSATVMEIGKSCQSPSAACLSLLQLMIGQKRWEEWEKWWDWA